MKYYHLRLLHDGAGAATVFSDADGLSYTGSSTAPNSMPEACSSHYTVSEDQSLASVTTMECKKISVPVEKALKSSALERPCCLHLPLSTTILELDRAKVLTLIESEDGSAVFDQSWEVRLGTWSITALEGAYVKTRRQIEEDTELVIYNTPGLVEHSVGTHGPAIIENINTHGWHYLEPHMRFGASADKYVNAIALGSCRYGDTASELQQFTTDGLIETIGGSEHGFNYSIYIGTRGKHGCTITPTLGSCVGQEFCWGPPSVGRIYAIRVTTGSYSRQVVIVRLSILSEM
ncbi:hypothetical protein JKP88DRAFT_253850 [Tribonema minus]|uniref:Uncharacterized protein n=1 Tax=Tribonema minus TaxID=303371 RepID=A0A835Z892_9STRA|nr:hypothetical protein JKP88DRAFT_253850 [Tribonema minus]